MKELLMGNEAIALAAISAGVQVVCGYPGTPSTEVLETVAKRNPGHVYVEWSVNEKTAMEVAAGAAYAGARVLVTMKQVGLNVASDPLMCVNYVGVKGGLVVLAADDPGPISSQTEQDTRHFGRYARIPVLDPATPEQAWAMTGAAFALSEQLGTPVILRPTTRVCHACASIDVPQAAAPAAPAGFEKSPDWVIFPRLSHAAKKKLFAREEPLSRALSESPFNVLHPGAGRRGVVCGGVSAAYVQDALALLGADCPVLTIGTPYPFPDALAERFMAGVDSVLVFEELDPVLEDALLLLRGRTGFAAAVYGKRTGHTITAGEKSANLIAAQLAAYLGLPAPALPQLPDDAPALPVRPPILCAGCPHRASFYAVKQATKNIPAVYSGDIGCYTLGNAAPLNVTDTCLCMGAGISIPQGLDHAGDKALHIGFVGDSTFFHSGVTNVINAVYNHADIIVCILDNATTAMTGHQPHPGIGRTAMGEVSAKISIEKLLEAIGVDFLRVVDPLDQPAAVAAVQDAAAVSGVRCIIFRAPCVAIVRPAKRRTVAADCRKCQKCIRALGCPALSLDGDGRAVIEPGLCTGCGLCAGVCGFGCIREVEK